MSIRNRILSFAVLVTLLPSIGLGWIYFKQTEKALLESSKRELLGTAGHIQREFDLWFKERYYEIRVFSNSYLLSEGLDSYLAIRGDGSGQGPSDGAEELAKLESYLSLVGSQFDHYQRLLVYDREGQLLIQSPQPADAIELPGDWRAQLGTRDLIVSETVVEPGAVPSILAAVPILSAGGASLGFLAAEVRLDALAGIMTSFIGRQELRTGSSELLLVDDDGAVLMSTAEQGATMSRSRVHEGTPRPHELAAYVNAQGVEVVGILAPMSEFSWGLVMEKRQDEVFSEVIGLRNQTLLGVALLVTLFGAFAYRISRGIISPLERLTDAAGRVADGDLDIEVPVVRHDELGNATEVFNSMVGQLKQSRDRLEQLSTTDALTQLANRKHVMEKLTTHLERFRRSGTVFSVLLVDADHFKTINDSAGHVVGDQVLRHLGNTFRRLLRTVDVAGRYGGEEFLIILDETRGTEALRTAERIRLAIESDAVEGTGSGVRFTVSIGVAEIGSGEAEDQLIMRADTALYQAKADGRNRSVLAKLPNANVTNHPAARKQDHS